LKVFMTHDLPTVKITGGEGKHFKQMTGDIKPKEFDAALAAAGKTAEPDKPKRKLFTTADLPTPEEKAEREKRAQAGREIAESPRKERPKGKGGRPRKVKPAEALRPENP